MTAVQKKMEEFIRRERLLEMGDRVVLGVSGGADSVCMMELFAAIREAWQLELLVVHVHHGLSTDEICGCDLCGTYNTFSFHFGSFSEFV